MTVKVGTARSALRSIEGGVPQGSLLGVLLFNITIDSFEAFSSDVQQYGALPEETLSEEELHLIPPDLPVDFLPNVRDYKHLPPFLDIPLLVQKYVDDNIILERLNFDRVATDGYTTRVIHAI